MPLTELDNLVSVHRGDGSKTVFPYSIRVTGQELAESLDYRHPDLRWVAKTFNNGRGEQVVLTPHLVVARGKKLVKVQYRPGRGGGNLAGRAFWVRRPYQAPETPREAVQSLLVRKKFAVASAQGRLDDQKRDLATVAVVCLAFGMPEMLVSAPAPARENTYSDYDDGAEYY